MSHQPEDKKDIPDEESTRTTREEEPAPALSLEEALLACMPAAPIKVASLIHDQANAGRRLDDGVDDDANQMSALFQILAEKEEEEMVVVPPPPPLLSSPASPLEEALLACMPGAFPIPGPSDLTTTTGANYTDPLHVIVEEEEEDDDDELQSLSSATTVDIEHAVQQPQTAQTSNIVSAYRVTEQEPIVATPLKDNRIRILGYGFLITAAVALMVGLSVGLTTKSEPEPPQRNPPVDRLVSSVNVTGENDGSFVKASCYRRTEDGKETVFTTGSAALNRCEVLPCNEGGCDFFYGKVYEPGCCRGDDCSPSDKCGYLCPERANLCHPSYVGCTDASCFECERGPGGEDLYRRRSDSFNINCLRTGVATGFNDKDDNVERIYKWAIGCGYNIRGGIESLNIGPGEYVCIAVRVGKGITKTLSMPLPCQLIQLAECGCAPDDVNTLGIFPPPHKPCKTKEDCPYLCGDAGEEKVKTLCDAFPGIKWWEGDNPLHLSSFFEPGEELWSNATVQIDIYGE